LKYNIRIFVYSNIRILLLEGDTLLKHILNTLKALSDETRLRILNILVEKELCVCDIIETLKITQTKASRHLNYLRNAGLVSDRKQAQWVYYSISLEESSRFIESLVKDNLRRLEIFDTDLNSLKEWLQRKSISCK